MIGTLRTSGGSVVISISRAELDRVESTRRRRGHVESAINACEAAAHDAEADLAEQVAVLAARLAQAHAFVDNDRRDAYIAVILLRENGHSLGFDYHIEAVLDRTRPITTLANWLRTVIQF